MSVSFLVLDGPNIITINTKDGKGGMASALAVDPATGKPLAGLPVRFHVSEGEAALGEDGEADVIVTTDEKGRAQVRVTMDDTGQSIIRVQMSEEPALRFVARTQGVTHSLDLWPQDATDADKGEITARIVARDHRDFPVEFATFRFEGHVHGDVVTQGSVTDLGGGVYEARLKSRKAGCWTILVRDTKTRVGAKACVILAAGAPKRIELMRKPNPRLEQPFDRDVIRARLVDVHGNSRPPHELTARIGDEALKGWQAGYEAQFAVTLTGSGTIDVTLEAEEFGIVQEVPVHFAHFWMSEPRVIEPGAKFGSEVRVLPSADRGFEKATLRIGFDPELVSFATLEPSSETPLQIGQPTVETDLMTVELFSKDKIPASKYPEGIPIGYTYWYCEGKGRTCFDVGGGMSPDVEGYMLCMEQKEEAENFQCVCVNIIYRAEHNDDRARGTAMVRQALAVIGSNTYFCCPIIGYDWNACPIDTNSSEYQNLLDEWMGDAPWEESDIISLFDSGMCQKKNCINLYVHPIRAEANVLGYARRETLLHHAATIIDPTAFKNHSNLAAHEFGHLFDLKHTSDRHNLMYDGGETGNAGRWISREQCEKIWDYLDDYPCGYSFGVRCAPGEA